MRILFASANFGEQIVGGAQLSVRLVAEQLVAKGHAVGVVRVEPNAAAPVRLATGVDSFAVGPRNLYWHRDPRQSSARRLAWHMRDRYGASLLPDYRSLLAHYRPDVVHSNVLGGLTVSLWRAAAELAIPIVHTVHDYYLVCGNSGMRNVSGNCSAPCTRCAVASLPSRSAAKHVHAVAFVSQHMRQVHERARVFAQDSHVTEIIGAYDPARPFHVKPVAAGPISVGFLGRLSSDKGVEEMLTSLSRLPNSSYRVRIGGVGSPEYESLLKMRTQGLPVEFCGRVDAAAFYETIDVLVVPSLWHEPAARVVYEAGLSGVPVIVSARGGLPQLVEYGARGWVYEPGDSGALAQLVARIAEDPAQAVAKAARWERARPAFSAAHIAEQTLRAYEGAREVHTRRRASRHLSVLALNDSSGV